MSSRPAHVRLAAVVAVVLVLAASGAAAFRYRDARPHPAVLFTDGSMTLAPAAAHPGQRLRARFTTPRVRTGLLTLTGSAGSYVVGGGRLLPIPANGRLRLTLSPGHVAAQPDARSFGTRLPMTLPAGRYRACSLDAPGPRWALAECTPLTVLGG